MLSVPNCNVAKKLSYSASQQNKFGKLEVKKHPVMSFEFRLSLMTKGLPIIKYLSKSPLFRVSQLKQHNYHLVHGWALQTSLTLRIKVHGIVCLRCSMQQQSGHARASRFSNTSSTTLLAHLMNFYLSFFIFQITKLACIEMLCSF